MTTPTASEVSPDVRSERGDVLNQLRAAIWQMESPSAGGEVLGYVKQVLEVLRIPFHSCLVFSVKHEDQGETNVSFRSLGKGNRWRTSTCPDTIAHVLKVWRTGLPCARAAVAAMSDMSSRAVEPVAHGALLDVPFSHGVLRLQSDDLNAYHDGQMALAGEVAEVLSGLFQRLEDLEELEARSNHVREVQNLALVGQLAAGAAHEINNSLTAVLGYCDLLLSDELDPAARDGVMIVNKAARQVQVIARVLLNLARRHRTQKEPLQMKQPVEEMIYLISRQLENENVKLVQRIEDDLPRVNGHAGQLQQVVLNLIQNSRDAILASGPSGTIIVEIYRRGDSVVLEVADDGPGIPQELGAEIFKPFFTTKKDSEGTGLGLSVCQEIVVDHRGKIYVDPRSLGTCFVVELPIAEF